MSEPKRYRLDPESYLAENPQGDFVDYQDYALLKAEVERLTKAGDAIIQNLHPEEGDWCFEDAEATWYAAKEGKPRA